MKGRIEHIIKAESLTNLLFAQLLDISPASVTHLLSGRNNPSLDFVIRIARKFPHYNLRWLILGEGPIYNNGNSANTGSRSANLELFSAEEEINQSKTTEENSRLATLTNQRITETNTALQTTNKETASPQQTLIVCLPDGTYREYTKQ